ncbi:RHS repeat-associated core domain-containing protein, partial [Vibrio metschnikovii]|uniref:RHS repeat-associated core domain-containing protein n=1 Tax=Vibrio metschnikovii TaxID=28172 RepID=UPI002FC899F8
NRYYDADSGQYLSPDPIGFAGGLRPQGYVHNPLEWVDPLGLTGCHTNKAGKNRRQAMNETKDAAGIPRSQQHETHWTVGDDKTRRGYSNYEYSENPSEHGNFYQYRDANGHKVVVVEHTNDPRNKVGDAHFHAGKAKTDPRNYNFRTERYGKVPVDKETGDHHIYYDY